MLGVPKELIEHALKVDSKAIPKKQRLWCFSPDKREAIKKELAKLLAVGFIKEVYHPEWLANPVLVQKKNDNEWRMCVYYTDLNKHCPMDPFGLPHRGGASQRPNWAPAPLTSQNLHWMNSKFDIVHWFNLSITEGRPSLIGWSGSATAPTFLNLLLWEQFSL